MITSNSTNEEIIKQLKQDSENVNGFITNKMVRKRNDLVKIFKVREYYTPNHPSTFHSHTTNIHWRILLCLMHYRKANYIERGNGTHFNIDFKHLRLYTIITDMRTNQPILVLPYLPYPFFISAHAIRRYRERYLNNADESFEDTCDKLTRRAPYVVCAASCTLYGNTRFVTVLVRVADGLLLGYFDHNKNITHLETFISIDMMNQTQKNRIAFKFNNERLQIQRDMCLGLIPYDEEQYDSFNCKGSYEINKDGMKELSPEDIAELVRISKEEYFTISEEERERIFNKEHESNRERYDKKMKRNGYF